ANERRAEIEQEFEQHAFSIREVQNRRETLLAARAELEAHIAANKTYLERAERNLKHAQNQKEYETAMRETDALQRQDTASENQIVEQKDGGEGADSALTGRSDEISTLDAQRDEALAACGAEVSAARSRFEEKNKRR